MANHPKSYHWISTEIEKLDPYVDYEKIWRLCTSYQLSDFANNMIYALTFPNFVVTPWGAQAVWREDGGKVLNKATHRVEQTENNNALWWYYGPSDLRTQKSIEGINRLHKNWAKAYPGVFSHNEDYVYTLAFSAVLMHRLRLRLGLSGFPENIKIASHLFWRDMSKYFYAEGGVPVAGFPEDWDSMLKYCEDFENIPREGTERGHLIAEAIYSQFAFRYFPTSLHWLGRSIPIALSLPTTLKAHKIEPVNLILKAVIVFLVGAFFWIAETLLPDPKVAFWETMENMTNEQREERLGGFQTMDQAYAPRFVSLHQDKWAGCPYHANLGHTVSESVAKDIK